ncbi:unnamed protein product [Mytilus coruscus]|uniref:Farnesoic acid O-methyl transferase domain-containing protein n=1 Tax=Mytilus coruscus TaxID=42192 RepID=A0A6J8DKM9_MYTCO|nr:unnamed protein product [Mytilus coruscus]
MRSSQPLYKIVIGAFSNTKTYLLRRNDDSLDPSSSIKIFPDHPNIGTKNLLSCSDYKAFWISWIDGYIKIGSGSTLNENIFADWQDPVPIEVKSIGICTFWGATGEWKLYVEDLFTGHFSGCSVDDNKADTIILQSMDVSRFSCGSICSIMDICFGFNFKATGKRCELLSINNLTNDIAKEKKEGWRFYSKCFKNYDQCLGCF